MTTATENPLSQVKAQIGELFRRLIQPHTTSFNLMVAAIAGIITLVFGVIILLLIMVAANFNLFNIIE